MRISSGTQVVDPLARGWRPGDQLVERWQDSIEVPPRCINDRSQLSSYLAVVSRRTVSAKLESVVIVEIKH